MAIVHHNVCEVRLPCGIGVALDQFRFIPLVNVLLHNSHKPSVCSEIVIVWQILVPLDILRQTWGFLQLFEVQITQ